MPLQHVPIFCRKGLLCKYYPLYFLSPLRPSTIEPVKITCRFYRLRYPPELYRALRRTRPTCLLFSPCCLDFHERRQARFILGRAHSLSLSPPKKVKRGSGRESPSRCSPICQFGGRKTCPMGPRSLAHHTPGFTVDPLASFPFPIPHSTSGTP